MAWTSIGRAGSRWHGARGRTSLCHSHGSSAPEFRDVLKSISQDVDLLCSPVYANLEKCGTCDAPTKRYPSHARMARLSHARSSRSTSPGVSRDAAEASAAGSAASARAIHVSIAIGSPPAARSHSARRSGGRRQPPPLRDAAATSDAPRSARMKRRESRRCQEQAQAEACAQALAQGAPISARTRDTESGHAQSRKARGSRTRGRPCEAPMRRLPRPLSEFDHNPCYSANANSCIATFRPHHRDR